MHDLSKELQEIATMYPEPGKNRWSSILNVLDGDGCGEKTWSKVR